MAEELNELKEQAEHAKDNPELAPVSITMAILAVLVAMVSLLGHRAHTEEVVLQAKASDQWAFYQAKNIRQHSDQLFTDLTSVEPATDAAKLAKTRDQYLQEISRYQGEKHEVETEARKLESEVAMERNRADRFDVAEVFLEVGLVVTSITLLTGRRLYWGTGVVLAIVGIALGATGFLVR
jgi:Domain of unknown function (DUF4337)